MNRRVQARGFPPAYWPDYEMDPEVNWRHNDVEFCSAANTQLQLRDDLLSIPSMSLTMPVDD
ncbi:MAG: hypothetical protein R3C28_04190 [Pirellulaceae bacterium]